MPATADPPPAAGFAPGARILKRWEFQQLQRQGRRSHGSQFVVIGGPVLRHRRHPERRGEGARLGMAVSKKVGGAVLRNRLRRLIREVFRAARADLPTVELVVIAKPAAAGLAGEGRAAVEAALLPLLQQAARRAGRAPGRARPGRRGRR